MKKTNKIIKEDKRILIELILRESVKKNDKKKLNKMVDALFLLYNNDESNK